MKIGIISDTHDHLRETKVVMEKLQKLGCQELIHCGDFCAPFMIKELSAFEGKVHCCFGNTDDRFTSAQVALATGVDLQGDSGVIEVDGKRLAFVHFPQVARSMAATGEFDAVFFGHSHVKGEELVGKTLLVNPGAIMEYKTKPSFAVYDTADGSVEFFPLE